MEAAIRVFDEAGYRKATTIRVAAVAGVSVGSLYQYFPNKLALLAGIKQRLVADLLNKLQSGLDGAESCLGGLRDSIRCNLREVARHRSLWVMFAEELPVRIDVRVARAVEAPHVAMFTRFLRRHAAEISGRDPRMAALVISEMVYAVTSAALQERPEDFHSGVLERELVEVVRLYLNLER